MSNQINKTHSTTFEDFLVFDWFYSTKERLSPSDVLTGLLDYGLFAEKLPPCFTSKGLTEIANEKLGKILENTNEKTLKDSIAKYAHDYIRYDTLRDINIPRHLGIPHPASYAIQALAISKYWKEIATHCNRPKPEISRIYARHVGNGRIFEMNYKGNERYQLEEEELEWMSGAQFVVKADITSCFPSIYTHSISWALHQKSKSKQNDKLLELYGNLLDKCTQNMRDRQTNGLMIGPHSSNIISEIVLTSIDYELQNVKNHRKIKRHVDDYTFYANTYDEAERFIKDLGMCLRTYEMSLNDKKTRILELPRPSEENWTLALNRFSFPHDGHITFSTIRSFLDLALECSQIAGKSTPLNYAIKMIAGKESARNLNLRAKRLYAQEAMNLALSYPYLVPLLDVFVFDRYAHNGLTIKIANFSCQLIKLGIKKLYPDTIAHALYYALKHRVILKLENSVLCEILTLNDCITDVLLFEYAKRHDIAVVLKQIKKRAQEIKLEDDREKDKNWLLIYQVWTESDLKGNKQSFLADLKNRNFQFLHFPEIAVEEHTNSK